MKIGILTYHRSHNFGALFQAIASRRYLESLGHEVYYINYWPNYHKAMYSPFSWWLFMRMGLREKYHYLKASWKNFHANIGRRERYNAFINKYIEPYYAPKAMMFDIIFYGSDQIWRKQPYINNYNPVYFAYNHYRALHHVSLSASVGILPKEEKDITRFNSLLGRFDHISVREQSLQDLIEHLGYKATLTCDPSLFLTAEQWNGVFPEIIINKKGYFLHINYIEDSFDNESLKLFARSKGLDYVCIDGSAIRYPKSEDLKDVAPLELFDYIRNAEIVCTSSFHALVFSIIFHKEVYASFKQNAKRAESLLNALDLSCRLIKPGSMFDSCNQFIDYSEIDKKIAKMRMDTFMYINTTLTLN